MPNALELRNVYKRYATHLAVDDLSLSVPQGSIFGVLGPNGAGKSTTIRMAMNIVGRDSGEVRLLGLDPAERKEVLRRVGYLPEERGLYAKMRLLDLVEFFGRLKGLTKRDARARGASWLERMGLGEWQRSRVEQLSKGMQQKVQFITTVMHEPELLILDEPASGLDPVNQVFLRETILAARDAGATIVLSTHNMKEAEDLCESVCIIAAGRKVVEGRVRDLRHMGATNRWSIEFQEPPAKIPVELAEVAKGGSLKQLPDGYEVELPSPSDGGALLAALARLERAPDRVSRIIPTLQDVFIARVGGDGATRPSRRAER